MDARQKLNIAKNIILKNYPLYVLKIDIESIRPLLKIQFFNGSLLYIRYNDYEGYSYQVIFS